MLALKRDDDKTAEFSCALNVLWQGPPSLGSADRSTSLRLADKPSVYRADHDTLI